MNDVIPMITSAYCLERISRPQHKGGGGTLLVVSFELRKWSQKFGKSNSWTARVPENKELHRQGMQICRVPPKSSVENQSVHICQESSEG